jgi:hypothetical protein
LRRLAGLMLLAWVLVGCYTVLKHPVLRPEGAEGGLVRVSTRDDCWSCHSSVSEHFWREEMPPAAVGYSAWDYYYATPWWLDAPYYGEQAGGETRLAEPRQFRRRETAEPTPGAPAVQQPTPTLQGVSRKAASDQEARSASEPPRSEDRRRTVARRDTTVGDSTKELRRERNP